MIEAAQATGMYVLPYVPARGHGKCSVAYFRRKYFCYRKKCNEYTGSPLQYAVPPKVKMVRNFFAKIFA